MHAFILPLVPLLQRPCDQNKPLRILDNLRRNQPLLRSRPHDHGNRSFIRETYLRYHVSSSSPPQAVENNEKSNNEIFSHTLCFAPQRDALQSSGSKKLHAPMAFIIVVETLVLKQPVQHSNTVRTTASPAGRGEHQTKTPCPAVGLYMYMERRKSEKHRESGGRLVFISVPIGGWWPRQLDG